MITSQAMGTLLGLLPALMLTGGAASCAALAAARPGTRPSLYRWIALIATAGAVAASLIELVAINASRRGAGWVGYSGGLIVDRFHVFGTVLVCSLLALAVLGSDGYARSRRSRAGALAALLQVTAAASVMLIAQREMAAFTAAFAVLVVSLVLLTAMTKTSAVSAEAAFHQALAGGVAMATTVYGLAVLYAAGGSTDLARLATGVRPGGAHVDVALESVGIAMVVVGLVAVVGAPPLEAWSRHLQQAAPGAVAGYGSAIGLVTGTTVLARFAVDGFGVGRSRWTLLVVVIAAIAMLTGSVLALRARTIRRLAGDLAVAQAGFLLLALSASGRGIDGAAVAGPTALLFTLISAALAVLAVLLLSGVLDAAGLAPSRRAYRGVGRRAPATAAFLSLALLGLGGLPPFAGFLGRLLAAEAALDAGEGWAVGVAAVASVLSAVSVVRWLAVMYADDDGAAPFAVGTTPLPARLAAWSSAGIGLLLTAVAGPLISLAAGGASSLH